VVWTAYLQEKPVISGGRLIEGFKRISGHRWAATLSEVKNKKWWFRQIFRDGKRLPRARFPNAPALLKITNVSADVRHISLDQQLIGGDLGNQDAELVVYQNWSVSRAIIRSSSKHSVTTATPVGWIGHRWTTADAGKPAVLEHALAFVDQPGEWYLDRPTGVLTYLAQKNQDPNRSVFIAPHIEQLLVIKGRADSPVQNLHFRGLTFAYSSWQLPQRGYSGIQAGHYGHNCHQPVSVLPAAIEWRYICNSSLERCRVLHTGASGIALGAGCRNNSIDGCLLSDIAGNGIMVGWRTKDQFNNPQKVRSHESDWKQAGDIPLANEITNCVIRRCGAVLHGCVGIYDAFCKNTRISQNVVTDLPYAGISIGYIWNELPTSQQGCVVEYNHVYDVMKMLNDGGCIYTLGYQPDTVIRGNLLHTVHQSSFAQGGAPNNGIFFDEGSKGYLVEGNIIYDTSGDPIRFNLSSRDKHKWLNNSFGVSPEDPKFPHEGARKAGLLPGYSSLKEDL